MMPTVSTSVCVEFSPQQMYDLVNDVQAYPEFLPLCNGVKVHFRSPTALRATLTLAKGKIKFAFTTANTMIEGKRIQMNLVDGPFKFFRGSWLFEPSAKGGCEATYKCDFEFSNGLLGLAFGPFFKEVMESLVDAFCQRAASRYPAANAAGVSATDARTPSMDGLAR